MIYLDSSVALAFLLTEERRPPAGFWDQLVISSRLLEYEVWNRLHARGLGPPRSTEAGRLLDRVLFAELTPNILTRALQPFPVAVRTLDGLHLATLEFLRAWNPGLRLASYDTRLLAAARALNIAVYEV